MADLALAIAEAGMAVAAADKFLQARITDFEGHCLTGRYADLETARLSAIAAAEALLDNKYDQACLVLKSWGIDPANRPRTH